MFSLRLRGADTIAAALFFACSCGACGDDKHPDEGEFDRWDACERTVSLCRYERSALSQCVERIETQVPDRQVRIDLVLCIRDARSCQDILEGCALPFP